MLIIVIEDSEGLQQVELHYTGREPQKVRVPEMVNSLFVGHDGRCIPNGIPAVVRILQEEQEETYQRPCNEEIDLLKKDYAELL